MQKFLGETNVVDDLVDVAGVGAMSTSRSCGVNRHNHDAWNSLPCHVRDMPSLLAFRRELKTVLFRLSYPVD